jgi:hypothetical protein
MGHHHFGYITKWTIKNTDANMKTCTCYLLMSNNNIINKNHIFYIISYDSDRDQSTKCIS